MSRIRELTREIAEALRVTGTIPLIRRYIVLGMFDGLLVSLSAVFASYLRGVDVNALRTYALSGILAVVVASLWNTLQAEILERAAEIRRIERSMFRPLRGTLIEHAHKISAIFCIVAHSLAPLSGLAVVYIYSYLVEVTQPDVAFYTTIAITATVLAALGLLYLGELTLRDILKMSALMTSASISLILLLYAVFGSSGIH